MNDLQLDDIQKYNKDTTPLGAVRVANDLDSEQDELEGADGDELDSQQGMWS